MIRYILFIVGMSISSINDSLAAIGGNFQAPPGVIDKTPGALVANIITYAIGIAAILGVIGITW